MDYALFDAFDAAAELLAMRATQRIEEDLPVGLRPGSFDEAYAIQTAVVAGLSKGVAPIGYKCACTSPIAQAALAVEAPLFGRLLAHSTSRSGARLDSDGFVHRVIEAEYAFRLGSDVPSVDGGHTLETIAAHIDAVIPAIEVVDYRYEDWTIGALQVAADNAIHGWWVWGEPTVDWRAIDLTAPHGVSVERNGKVVTTGSGANVLGHPLAVMAWLADELPRRGLRLSVGDLVTTGVTTDVFEASAGDRIRATFAGVGQVELTFT